MITFQKFGDSSMLVNFELKIDPEINNEVIKLAHAIQKESIPEIKFITPAYCSITIGFNNQTTTFEKLQNKIELLKEKVTSQKREINTKILHLPVCYEPPYSIDLQELTKSNQLSESEIIKLHTSTVYRVYMIGFLPGFPYMGTLPIPLFCNRKKTPRLRVPAQSVALAGLQTGIYPSEAPGGWQIIGRTPIPIFQPKKEKPFLLKAGDLVQFQSISKQSYLNIEQDIKANKFDFSTLLEDG